MTLEELKKELEDVFYDMQDYALAFLWNDYCDDCRYYDDKLYTMDMLDDIFSGLSPLEVLDKVGRDFDTSCDFWKDTIYGVESVSNVIDEIDMESLIDWLIEKGTSDEPDINDLLEAYASTNTEDDNDD